MLWGLGFRGFGLRDGYSASFGVQGCIPIGPIVVPFWDYLIGF